MLCEVCVHGWLAGPSFQYKPESAFRDALSIAAAESGITLQASQLSALHALLFRDVGTLGVDCTGGSSFGKHWVRYQPTTNLLLWAWPGLLHLSGRTWRQRLESVGAPTGDEANVMSSAAWFLAYQGRASQMASDMGWGALTVAAVHGALFDAPPGD